MGFFSLSEYLVENFYQLKYWMVEKNVPIRPPVDQKQIWGDLDVLAIGGEDHLELHLVNCKDAGISFSEKKDIVDNLDRAEKYIKRTRKYTAKIPIIKKIYVYWGDTDDKTLDYLRNNQIEAESLEALFVSSIRAIDKHLDENSKRSNGRYYGNYRETSKLIEFMLESSLLDIGKINNILSKKNLGLLSKWGSRYK